MSTRRVLGFTIALLDIILVVATFLPYAYLAENFNVSMFKYYGASIYPIYAFLLVGIITAIIDKKAELNFLAAGALLEITVAQLIGAFSVEGAFSLFQFGFYVTIAVSVFQTVACIIHTCLPEGPKKKKKVTQVNQQTTVNNGVQQRTNSLNMNMPVNNYQSLPVTIQEKEKAPMDILLAGKDAPPPLGSTIVGGNGIQSHLAELQLKSVNISQDNPTGAMPAQMHGQNPQMMGQMPQQMPQQGPAPAPGPMPVQGPGPMPQQMPAPGMPPGSPVPGLQGGMPQPPMSTQQAPQKPDLLAGSQMSGQMDTSPYAPPQPIQPGQGQFF